jgi:hypothetical protein
MYIVINLATKGIHSIRLIDQLLSVVDELQNPAAVGSPYRSILMWGGSSRFLEAALPSYDHIPNLVAGGDVLNRLDLIDPDTEEARLLAISLTTLPQEAKDLLGIEI